MKQLLLLFGFIVSAGLESVSACTNVYVAAGGARLVASNLDCSNYVPRIWFVPAGDGQFGRYCYGTDKDERIAEGGVNDHGLFIGVNALNQDTGWRPDPPLPDWEEWEGWYGTGVPDGILARCSTVDEAVAVFKAYNLFTLNRVKFLIADAGGASAVVEWSGTKLVILSRGSSDFQISTNFVYTGCDEKNIPCTRYRIAQSMLSSGTSSATVDGLRRLLSATHLEFQTPTVVSTICDLRTGDLLIYYFHDFEQPIALNLHEELRQGRHGGPVAELLTVKPYVATVYEGFAGGK